MGLFDTITYKGDKFQSKSLECTLSHYEITKEGRLVRLLYKKIKKSKKEIAKTLEEYPSLAKKFGSDLPLVLGFKFIKNGREDTNFHGILNFYGCFNRQWEDYNAKFTNGQLVEVIPSPVKPIAVP